MKRLTNKMIQTSVLALGLTLFTACGGGGGSTAPSAQSIAIDKIEVYATSGGTSPTVADYVAAGVTGVTEDNLAEINEVVEGLSAEDVDTEAELQALADALGIVLPSTAHKLKLTVEGTSFEVSIFIAAGLVYDYNIDCDGDGTNEATSQSTSFTCEYTSVGPHKIHIEGAFPRIFFGINTDAPKLLSVDNWGTTAWTDMRRAFAGCENLHILATDAPDLSVATSVLYMFSGATVMNEDISAWNMSHIEDFQGMFSTASNFNQDIGGWNVSAATTMSGMFSGASSFNQDLSSWDVSQVTQMNHMFEDASLFDQSLGAWNIAEVGGMMQMLDNSGLSSSNYTSTLIGWYNLPSIQTNVILGADGLTRTIGGLGQVAYSDLTTLVVGGGHGWTINDDGT